MEEFITFKFGKGKSKTGYLSQEDKDLVNRGWIDNKGYPQCSKNGRKIRMHTIIIERIIGRKLNKNELPDHINGNGADNRRSNLRVATRSLNKANSKIYKNNTSGYRGVCLYRGNKYHAACAGKHIGFFNNSEDAARAYDKAAIEQFGEFARTNFPRENYVNNFC